VPKPLALQKMNLFPSPLDIYTGIQHSWTVSWPGLLCTGYLCLVDLPAAWFMYHTFIKWHLSCPRSGKYCKTKTYSKLPPPAPLVPPTHCSDVSSICSMHLLTEASIFKSGMWWGLVLSVVWWYCRG
jgi:hypothetical protein